MATVSGQIVFDRNRSATIDSGDSGIAIYQLYYKI
ncbi:cell surface protein [Clostridioides difficile]|nr:hypothetical protein BER40_001819 [Clostridioides difficile]VFD32033.1 cell surface protein [Clostridioides difficile]VFD41503.1 cell surface protein [Clostridioides difficile]